MVATPGLFISATGTGVGKTHVTVTLARALKQRYRVAAVKPFETGCTPLAQDALALAQACDQPALAACPAFYRAALARAPWAVTLETNFKPPDLMAIRAALQQILANHEFTLVEGAGGLLVPLDADTLIADFIGLLNLPLILVAPDELGTISHTIAAVEAARARQLEVLAIVLSESRAESAIASNRDVLQTYLSIPVYRLSFGSAKLPDALMRIVYNRRDSIAPITA